VEGKGERTGGREGEGESGTMLKEVQGSQGKVREFVGGNDA